MWRTTPEQRRARRDRNIALCEARILRALPGPTWRATLANTLHYASAFVLLTCSVTLAGLVCFFISRALPSTPLSLAMNYVSVVVFVVALVIQPLWSGWRLACDQADMIKSASTWA